LAMLTLSFLGLLRRRRDAAPGAQS
jgi:hypothetical protein